MLNRALLLCTVVTVSWLLAAGQDRDDYYESDEFWKMPDDGRKCEPGKWLNGEKCDPCEVGQYNFEDARVDVCFPCPFGSFGNETGMTGCHECENWNEMRRGKYVTKQHGSKSADECLRPDEVAGNFVAATVGFRVKVKGGDYCTDIKTALWGISKVAPFDGHFYQCDYSPKGGESPAFTSMAFELTLPRNFALDFWMVMDMVETHRAVGNAWVKMGRHYLEKIAEFVKNHSDMKQIGFDLNVGMLKIDDIELMEFKPYFKAQCPVAGDNSPWCDIKDPGQAAKVQRYYVKYTVSGNADCKTNAGYTRVRNAIERSDERGLDCLNRANDPCTMELVSCKDGKAVAAFVNTVSKSNADNSIDFSQFDGMAEAFSDDDIQFSKEKAADGCRDGSPAVLRFNDDFSAECGACEPGQFINNVGMCQSCPFGSWGEDGKQCNACSWGYVTPFWGMANKDMCLQTDNEWEMTKDDKDWWDQKRLRDLAGENSFGMAITPEMNMCGVTDAMKKVQEKCKSAYSETELKWNDELDMDKLQIPRIVCMGALNVQKGFSEMCEDSWDKSWSDIFKRLEDDLENGDNWNDVLCFVFKKVRDLEKADTSSNCQNLDVSQYMMNMPITFDARIGAETSAVLFPIMKRLKNLETMNFGSFAKAGKAMMTSMGIEDMAAFTGWKMANELRDVGFEVPKGFRMAKFAFEPKFEKSDFVCDNGGAKRRCDGGCDRWRCKSYGKDQDKDLFCKRNECENCKEDWFWKDGEEEKPYECASCDFPKTMDNGVLLRVNADNVEAEYRCNDGFVLQDCTNMARCDYNSDPKKIEFPNCVEDKCDWPKVENAEKWRDWRDEQNWNSCPYAMYKCNDGWMAANHHNRVECKPNENFRIENHMQCIEACTFPEKIDLGDRVEKGRREDGRYYAKYKCNEGFYLREREWGECDMEERDGKQIAVARLPRCKRGDTCTFPEQINGARKDEEWFDKERGKKGARYECPEGQDMEGDSQFHCKEDNPSEIDMHEIKCFESKKCEFPEKIDNGKRVNEQTYEHNARYECDEGYKPQEKRDWAECDRKSGSIKYLPKCVKDDDCHLPDWIDSGYRSEKEYNRAKYGCHGDDWSLPDSISAKDGWVECDGEKVTPEYPKCEQDSCHLPSHIDRGRREEKKRNKARYACNNEEGYKLPDSIREKDGWVMCEGAEVKPEHPNCQTFNCVFNEIDNGEKEFRDDPTGMRAWYKCKEGFRLKNRVNEARCDVNGNVEYPVCIKKGDRCDFSKVDIDNGRVKEDDRDDYSIKVECNEGFRIRDGKDRVFCGENGEVTFRPECERFKQCDYPDSIPDGYKTADTRENGVRYECNGGFEMEGDDWASCDTTTGELTYKPVCKRKDEGDDCDLPGEIENGKRAEKHRNKARYECEGEWKLPYSIREKGGWVECKGSQTYPEHPRCVKEDGKCHFPDMIFAGYKIKEGEHNGEKYAMYGCIPPYVMTPNKDAFMGLMKQGKSAIEAYMDMAYIGACHMGYTMLPRCVEPKKARHCGIPNWIENGKAFEMYMKDHDDEKADDEDKNSTENKDDMDEEYKKMLKMMPMGARYKCNEGFKMHKTIKGDWGWCRRDGSFEIPRCEPENDWWEVEFKLHNGNEKKFADSEGKPFAGIVLVRDVDKNGPSGDWEYGCNDGFNSHAAGAICRSLGYRHGAQTPLTRKMQVMSPDATEAQRGFGWTGFGCKFDDTLASSANCRAQRYKDAMKERGMKAKCFDFDKLAVKCFDHAEFNFTVSLTYSNRKISCRAMAEKESYMLDLSRMKGVEAKFMMDDKEIDAEGAVQKYKIRKGYFMKIKDLKKKDFKCLSCEVHAGDMMLGKDERCRDNSN